MANLKSMIAFGGLRMSIAERPDGAGTITSNRGLGRVGQVACGLIAFAITVTDAITPAGLELAPLYVLALIALGLTGASDRSVWTWTAFCLVGSLFRFFGLGDPRFDLQILQGLLVADGTILGAAAMVCQLGRYSRSAMSEHRYGVLFDNLAVAVWEHDMSPVKATLNALRASGVTDVRSYLSANPKFVQTARRSVRITDVNATALRLMGVDRKEDFFRHLSDFLPENDASFEKCMIAIDEGASSFHSETEVRASSGELIPIIVALYFPPGGSLTRISGCILDNRDRIRLEADLSQSRYDLGDALRAASLAELTASIAHEIGQPLTAASGYVHACRRMLSQNEPDLPRARELVDGIVAATTRANEVMRGVRRRLIRPPTNEKEFAFDRMVGDAIQIVIHERNVSTVKLEADLRAGDAVSVGDRLLLQQVVINLMHNALDATRDRPDGEGIVRIVTSVSDRRIVFEVRDNGGGFTEESLREAFRPFFTTRTGALGLGLSISRSTIEMHGGTIAVETTSGDGTCLRVTLPERRR